MEKFVIYIFITIGMGLGGYLPVLFGQSALGGSSILGGAIGGFLAIWIYFKLKRAGYF